MKTLSEYERYAPLLARIEGRGDSIERIAVINEALSWLGTKFHMGARIKGVGVDCGEFLIAVYSTVGVMPNYKPGLYSKQWHLHEGAERYIADVSKFARQVDEPQTGDFALFHLGRHYAHSAIIIEWPERVVHAPALDIPGGVQLGDASRDALLMRGGRRFPPIFFSPWDTK